MPIRAISDSTVASAADAARAHAMQSRAREVQAQAEAQDDERERVEATINAPRAVSSAPDVSGVVFDATT